MAEWEPLADHLKEVAAWAAANAAWFGMERAARVQGLLHDIGKVVVEYLAYISEPREDGRKGPDHSTARAREATRLYGPTMGRMLAYAIAGHHAGLADVDSLDRRLSETEYDIKDYDGWQAQAGPLPVPADLMPTRIMKESGEGGFTSFFLTRMLFSALVDADFLATESFYARAEKAEPARGGHLSIEVLRDRLRQFMADKQAQAVETPVNALRRKILDHAVSKAKLEPGLFTLTVPTGGGKTLASLSFALEHAARHGLRRVVHVYPSRGRGSKHGPVRGHQRHGCRPFAGAFSPVRYPRAVANPARTQSVRVAGWRFRASRTKSLPAPSSPVPCRWR